MRSYLNFRLPAVMLICTAIGLIISLSSTVYADNVTLAWDASSSSPDGYHLYMRAEGQAYDFNSPVWSGTGTSCTISNLAANTYYFVARAYEGTTESVNSNEIEYKVVVNQPPQADAGADQAVSAGTQVTLDGSASTDPDGSIASYHWTQTSGPSVSLANATTAQASFTAPSVTTNTTLGFQITVTDSGGLSSTDSCQVTVVPVATSGGDGSSGTGSTTGSGSSQTSSGGSQTGSIGSQTGSTKIWIEAEAGDINAPMAIEDDANASNGEYIEVPNGNGTASTASKKYGYAEYTFDVPVAGDYLIWGRTLADNGRDNSFFVSMDDSTAVLWNIKGRDNWIWEQVEDGGNTSAQIYHLTAGTHKLTIYQREDGTKIDRILITNDPGYTPVEIGENVTSTSPNIWLEAEAGDIYAPMTIEHDANASSGEYIEVPNGNGTASTASKNHGYAEYTFDVPVAGDYLIWGRTLADNGRDNSFFVSMDDGTAVRWNIKGRDNWIWEQVEDGGNTSAQIYHLTAGTHKLTIYQREDGTKIDKIMITHDVNYIPENMGL